MGEEGFLGLGRPGGPVRSKAIPGARAQQVTRERELYTVMGSGNGLVRRGGVYK
jgi:hypothetical protein